MGLRFAPGNIEELQAGERMMLLHALPLGAMHGGIKRIITVVPESAGP
jgi:hypothetical protein